VQSPQNPASSNEGPSLDACPLCDHGSVAEVLDFPRIPVFANVLFDTKSEATAAPHGRMDLVVCTYCGLIYNRHVDPALLAYSPAYENSLHHSAVFEQFATGVAERLVSTYNLVARDVVEIGPGNGDFLTMMVKAGASRGIGYDPSHNPETAVLTDGVMIHSELYPDTLPVGAGAVTSRHVLEHLDSPAVLLEVIRSSLSADDDAVVYLEVPDATYMVESAALWDVIYEHLTYTSEATLNWACERAGLNVVASGRAFADQYLWNESTAGVPKPDLEPPDPSMFVAAAVEFGAIVEKMIADWSSKLEELTDDGPVAVWGAGSKGTSFLSMVPAASRVDSVVDVNPAKKGRFVPGSGHEICAPADLGDRGIAHVVVMNPIYRDEIAAELASLGMTPGVHSM